MNILKNRFFLISCCTWWAWTDSWKMLVSGDNNVGDNNYKFYSQTLCYDMNFTILNRILANLLSFVFNTSSWCKLDVCCCCLCQFYIVSSLNTFTGHGDVFRMESHSAATNMKFASWCCHSLVFLVSVNCSNKQNNLNWNDFLRGENVCNLSRTDGIVSRLFATVLPLLKSCFKFAS